MTSKVGKLSFPLSTFSLLCTAVAFAGAQSAQGLLQVPTTESLHESCLDSLQTQIQIQNEIQSAIYRAQDPHSDGIGKGNESRLIRGKSDRVAVVMHGFAASPFEVQDLGDHLVSDGYTVYLPLLPGFGSTSEVANLGSSDLWKDKMSESVRMVSNCFSDISLVGFSTGGSLVANFLLNDPKVTADGGYDAKAKIRAAALLSPYFASGSVFTDMANATASKFVSTMDAKTLYSIHPTADLLALIRFPDHYNRNIPLDAGAQVVALGTRLRQDTSSKAISQVPVLLGYSESDETISPTAAKRFVNGHFERNNKFVIGKSGNVPHQIALTQMNPGAASLFSSVAEFLNSVAN